MMQGKTLPSEVGLQNLKFDTALILNRLRTYQRAYPEKKTKNQRRLEGILPNARLIKTSAIGVEIIAVIFDRIFSLSTFKNNANLFEYLKAAVETLAIQEEHLLHNSPMSYNDRFFNNVSAFNKKLEIVPKVILQFFEAAILFDNLMQSHQLISNVGINYISKHKDRYQKNSTHINFLDAFNVYLTRQEIIFVHGLSSYYLVSDQLLMIHNKIHETLNTFLLGWLLSGVNWSSDFFETQIRLMKMMVKKVNKLGCKAYSLFKNFDGIATGYIMSHETIFPNREPIENILRECEQDKLITSHDLEVLIKAFDRTAAESLEMSAHGKLLGHPDIDTHRGIDKLRKRTFQNNPIDYQEISDLLSSCKKNFIHQYLLKKKKWPIVEFESYTNPALRYCCLMNLWIHDISLPTHLPKITLRDFNAVNLSQVEEFDSILSQFDYLKDTALAETRSVLNSKTVHKVSSYRLKRTLIYFLISTSPHTGVVQYMNKVANRDPLCLEYCVIKLTQKERELKEEGRLFGQSPYEERARRCILEANVAKLLEKYNRNQAMTLSELQKFQKLYTLSRLPSKYSDYYSVVISVDVEAWNNNFRRIVCEPIGREFFDKLLGVEHFSKIMDVFENSVFVISDGMIEFRWDGQLGGIEGLAQKFWTLIYESVASRVADLTGYQNFIMVNGDDLRVILLIPKKEVSQDQLKALTQEIAASFELNYKKYGFNLKVQETYFSTSLLGFGKVYLHSGSFCSLTLKKGSKLHGLANLIGDYPLEYIKGVFSECVSTMAYSTNHRCIFIVSIIRYFMYLSKFCPKFSSLSFMNKIVCTLLPRNFGGFPILPYLRGLYKGDSDLETVWWSLYFFIYKHNKELGKRLFLLTTSMIKKCADYSGLAMNPYSIPNKTPPEGFSAIQSFIRRRLIGVTKNVKFKQLLTQSSDSKKKEFLNSLYSCNPIPAKPLSVIYETSACGIVDEFVSRFDSSKSIGALVSKFFTSSASLRILRRAKQMDLNKIQYLITLISSPNKVKKNHLYEIFPDHVDCPTRYSDLVRTWCYGKPIVGITYPCISDQVYVCAYEEIITSDSLSAITFWKDDIPPSVNPNYEHGSNKIFIGNHTHLKLLAPDLEINNSSPGLRRLTKLLKLYSMMSALGPECEKFLDQNLEDLTGLDAQILKSAVYHYTSGSITHRVPTNHWSPLVGPNELSNQSTFIKSTTRTDSRLKTKGGDYTINFGLIRAHINKVAMYEYEFNGLNYPTPARVGWAQISECPSCTYEVSDKPVQWTKKPPMLSFNLINNEYATLNDEDVTILKTKLVNFSKNKHVRIYEHLDNSNESHILLSRILVARNFLVTGNEEIRNHLIQNQSDASIDEEDLSVLFAVSNIELANLTDLKCTPCDILWSTLVEFMTSWYFSNYPDEFGSGTLESLVNVKPQSLPLSSFSDSLIEAGYWPIFHQYIKRHTNCDPPPQNCSNKQSIQTFLNRVIIRQLLDMEKSPPSLTALNHVIPISNFPSNEDVIKMAEFGLKQTFYKVIKSWLLTIEGRSSWTMSRNGNYDGMIPVINSLLCLSSNLKYKSLDDIDLKLFSYNVEKDDSYLIVTILRLMGVPFNTVNKMIDHLREFEPAAEDDAILTPFLSVKVSIEILPLHESVTLVRQIGNDEFVNYHRMKQHFEDMRTKTSGDDTDIILTTTRGQSSEIPFIREHELIGGSLLTTRFHRIRVLINTINQRCTIVDKFKLLKIIGSHGHQSVGLQEILKSQINTDKKSRGLCLILNDRHGSYTSGLLTTYPNSKCVNFSFNSISPSSHPDFQNLDAFMLTSSSRIDLSLSRLSIGDLTNVDHRYVLTEWIKKTYDSKIMFLVLNYAKNIQEKLSFQLLTSIILSEFKELIHANGSIIIRVGHQIPDDFSDGLCSLAKNFNCLKVVNSVLHSYSHIDLYIICTSKQDPAYQDLIVSDTCVQRLLSVFSSYEIPPTVIDSSWNVDFDYTLCKKLFKVYGRQSRMKFDSVLQSISLKFMPYDHTNEYDKWINQIHGSLIKESGNLIRILRMQVPTGPIYEGESYISSGQHTLRILIELHLMLYFVDVCQQCDEMKDRFALLFEKIIIPLDIIIGMMSPEIFRGYSHGKIKAILGKEWCDNDYTLYKEICLSFFLWNLIRFD